MRRIGHIAELWRYPVKSMAGESLPTVELNASGIAGDRLYAFQSSAAPIGKPLLRSAERTRILQARASLDSAGEVHVNPGTTASLALSDPALLAALAIPEASPAALSLLHSDSPLTDVRPVSLHTTALVAQLSTERHQPFDGRRLRSNLVLSLDPGLAEPDLLGHRIQVGDHAQLQILEPIPRCRIISLAPLTAEPDPTLLRHVAQTRDGHLGLYARTLTPGTLRLHNPVFIL